MFFFKKKVNFFIFYFNYWLKRGHLNRSVDIRYSIVAFNVSLLTVKLQLGLPYRKFEMTDLRREIKSVR